MKIAEAVQVIQQEFEKRYGFQVRVEIMAYDQTQEVAEKVMRDMVNEFGHGEIRSRTYKDSAWTGWEVEGISVTVFHSIDETKSEGRQ